MEVCKKYFMELLGEDREKGGEGGRKTMDGEQEIGREEVRRAVARLKVGKAMGKDCIPNEV